MSYIDSFLAIIAKQKLNKCGDCEFLSICREIISAGGIEICKIADIIMSPAEQHHRQTRRCNPE